MGKLYEQGSRNGRLAGLVLCIALGGLLAWSAPALAARGHIFSTSFAGPGSGNGELNEPAGVAVNDSTHDVYVVDKGNNRVEEFSASGGYIGQFDGAGSPTGVFSEPEGIAIDNSTSTEDPSAGDVYVVDRSQSVIDKFSSSGAYLGQLTGAEGQPFGGLAGVAIDQNGVVWVAQESAGIDSFSDAAVNEFLSNRTPQVTFGLLANPVFAVDSADNLYVRSAFGEIDKLNSSGEVVESEIGGSEAASTTAAAVDLSSDELFLDNVASIGAFSPTGSRNQRFGSGHLTSGTGVGVDTSSEYVYVADSTQDTVEVFAPEPTAAPVVAEESVISVTATGVTFSAQINANGVDTHYYLQYGTESCTASPASCTDLPAAPGADIGSGFGPRSLSAELQDLQPGTTYHYSVIASSAAGTGPGADQTFTTPSLTEFALPDGREWELVSPASKNGARIEGFTQAAENGTAVVYHSSNPIVNNPPGNPEEDPVISTRGSNGWSSQDLSAAHEVPSGASVSPEDFTFSSDLTSSIIQSRPGYSEPRKPLYVRNDATDTYEALVTPENVQPAIRAGIEEHGPVGNQFEGASPNGAHVVFESTEALISGAPTGIEAKGGALYEWTAGHLQLVSVLPDDTPYIGTIGGGQGRDSSNDISGDGSRVFWEASPPNATNSSNKHLYMTDLSTGKSVQVDAAQGVEESEGESGSDGAFRTASSDGSEVFFVSGRRLTADSTADGAEDDDLYVYDAEAPEGERLTDLTVDRDEGETADVRGAVLGTSEDGSSVYFVATGVLASGENPGGEQAVSGTDNLYLDHNEDGSWTTTFIARLATADGGDWAGGPTGENVYQSLGDLTARVSPNGRYLAFMSERSLTGYHNVDAISGAHDQEVFEYDASSDRITCVSCNPSDARPVGIYDYNLPVDQERTHSEEWLAGSIPGWRSSGGNASYYQPRYLSDSGRLFFNSPEAYVPQDTNGKEDVYEYEPDGVGGCGSGNGAEGVTALDGGGCIAPISSGTGREESLFEDASATGDDVFFLTAEPLVAQDKDTSYDMYDAHVCTAASPCTSEPVPPPECITAESCHPAPSAQPGIFGAPPSATFSGAGNVAPQVTSKTKPKAKSLTRAQKLSKALSSCRKKSKKKRAGKKSKKKRAVCEARARKIYGVRKAKKSKAKKSLSTRSGR